jgi:group I intron endonuclease
MIALRNRAGIYRIRIDRPGLPPKFYIGQAAKFRVRKATHFRDLRKNKHCNSFLQRAYLKYGENAFSFEIIIVCPKDKEMLNFYEQLILDTYDGAIVYNILRECVYSNLGRSQSAITRQKISTKLTGLKRTEEYREECRKRQIERMSDQSKRDAIAEKVRKIMEDPERRESAAQLLRSMRSSPEHMDFMRSFLIGRTVPQEQIDRARETFKKNYIPRPGRKLSAEEIARRQATRLANRQAQGIDRY